MRFENLTKDQIKIGLRVRSTVDCCIIRQGSFGNIVEWDHDDEITVLFHFWGGRQFHQFRLKRLEVVLEDD